MNNSIYYYGFNKLLALTKCPKEALLLDKILFYHQGTLLKKENKLWFTKKIPDIAKELGFSESRIYVYLKNLEELGLIIRKRFKFYGVPRAFITTSEKLQNLLQLSGNPTKISIDIKEKTPENYENEINERMDSPVSIDSINKVKNRVINNITCDDIGSLTITAPELNTVKGMLLNVQRHHGVKLSSPNQVFDEVLFSISNSQQFHNAESFQHKINIISKLLRQGNWKTPKGFAKYSPMADKYQKQNIKKEENRKKIIIEELIYCGFDEFKANEHYNSKVNPSIKQSPQLKQQTDTRQELLLQQSVINGIEKNLSTIKNSIIRNGFIKILEQEKIKLLQIKDKLLSA